MLRGAQIGQCAYAVYAHMPIFMIDDGASRHYTGSNGGNKWHSEAIVRGVWEPPSRAGAGR